MSSENGSIGLALSPKAKKHLKGLAHGLKPVVHVGKAGINQRLRDALDQALLDHELVKVRILDTAPIERKQSATLLASEVGALPVNVIGRIAILYRAREKDPVIVLPK